MKSLFKRTLAAASGSVLALTQFGFIASNVNISAADVPTSTAAATAAANINSAFLLNVPINEGGKGIAPDPLAPAHSDWSNKLESALLVSGDKSFEFAAESIKNKAKTLLTKGGYLSAAEVEAIVAKISDAKVDVTSDGNVTATIELAEIGNIIGGAFQSFVGKAAKIDFNDPEAPITFDWSKFSVKGKIVIEAKADFSKNTVTYTTTVYDEKNNKLTTFADFEKFANAKLDEAADIVLTAANKTFTEKSAALADAKTKLDDANQKLAQADKDLKAAEDANVDVAAKRAEWNTAKANYDQALADWNAADAKKTDAEQKLAKAKSKLEKTKERTARAKEIANDISKISVTGNNIDTVYTTYLADVEKAAGKRGASVIDENTPQTITSGLESERGQKAFNKAVEFINKTFAGTAQVSLTTAEIEALYKNAITQQYTVNGFNAEAVLTVADDQAAALTQALKNSGKTIQEIAADGKKDTYSYTVVQDTKDGAVITDFSDEKNYEIIGVYSEKTITAKADTTYGLNGSFYFDVARDVKQVIVKVTDKTTTPTQPTGTEPTGTQPTGTQPTGTQPTGTQPTGTQPTETQPTDTQPTGTQPTGTQPTETQPTGTQPTGTQPTGTEPTETQPTGTEQTGTKPTGTQPTETQPTETQPIQTEPTLSAEIVVNGIEDKARIYWAEEKTAIDLSKLSINLFIYKNGVKGEAIDITDAFAPTAKNVSDLKMPAKVGIYAAPIEIKLTDETALQKKVLQAGGTQALLTETKLTSGYVAGKFSVYLVRRGDADLDGEITIADAQYATVYYTETLVGKKNADVVLKENTDFLATKEDKKDAYFTYFHFAADAKDGDGIVAADDAQIITNYYVVYVLGIVDESKRSWTAEDVAGDDVAPKTELHADPLALDAYCEKVARGFDSSVAQ